MNNTCLFFLSLFFFGQILNASTGSAKGNGGYAVACETQEGITYQALDLFEAEQNRQFTLLRFESKSPFNIALQVVSQIKAISPSRAQQYSRQIRYFKNDSSFVQNARFTDVQDAFPIYLPNNCKLVPVATQIRFSLPGDDKFFVNQDIWDKLSPLDQAAIMVHEVVYMEFGHELSVLTRSFVGLLFSEHFKSHYTNPKKFLELLLLVKAPYYEQQGLFIDLRFPIEVYPDTGIIKSGKVMAGLFNNGINGSAGLKFTASNVEFYRNGFPSYLKLDPAQKNYFTVPCMGPIQMRNLPDDKIYFYKNGALWKSDFVWNSSAFKNDCSQLQFEVDTEDAIEMTEENESIGYRGSLEFAPDKTISQSKGLKVKFQMVESYYFPTEPLRQFILKGKISYWPDLRAQSGTLQEQALLDTVGGPFVAAANHPVKFKKNGQLECATSETDQYFEGEHRNYLIKTGQNFCFEE